MLVVIPPSVRHEETLAPSYYEDHLLERVSILELRLAQIAERLSVALDLMLRQAKTSQTDHLLLETLIESLQTAGVSEKKVLASRVRERLENDSLKEFTEAKNERIIKKILLHHEAPISTDLFANLVKEGIRLLAQGEEKQAFRALEQAARVSPNNLFLQMFLAESLFRADKFEAAKKHLENVLEIEPQDLKAAFLRGVIFADEGESENARRLLSLLLGKPEAIFCVNFIWGFLAASEEKWMEALAAFKEVLNARETPETHYLAACAYFQLRRLKTARKHLESAVEIDKNYADAWFMLGVVENFLEEDKNAVKAFEKAGQAKDAGAQCLEFLRRGDNEKKLNLEFALPFLRLKKSNKHLLLTGGARRLTKIFREGIDRLIQ